MRKECSDDQILIVANPVCDVLATGNSGLGLLPCDLVTDSTFSTGGHRGGWRFCTY